MHTIRLFMWGYQPHFQISATTAANGIFSLLDQSLDPNAFLVGVLSDDSPGKYLVCVEPEDYGYDENTFLGLHEQAKQLESEDEEQNIFHSDPRSEKSHKIGIGKKAIKNSILEKLRESDSSRGLISFCSWPILVEGYNVCVVLQVRREAFDSHYSLQKDTVASRYHIQRSLVEATVSEYFKECEKELQKPNPGSNLGVVDREYSEILRSAGRSLMYTPAWAGGNTMGLHGLFNVCNTISSLRYEGIESVGSLLISKTDHPNTKLAIQFDSAINLYNPMAVRKLIELSTNELSIICDSYEVFGLGSVEGAYDETFENLFRVNFTAHHSWELLHNNKVLMQVAYGQPSLPKPPFNITKFNTDLERLFKGITKSNKEQLIKLVTIATHQSHGTMVVISEGAEKEAERLRTQSTVVKPFLLNSTSMQTITNIDGSVLISPDGTCYAIGVILDGMASSKGTPSRGARYNSAIRYIESSRYQCVAVVISEDGSIDLIPDLKPQIYRQAIDDSIHEFTLLMEPSQFQLKVFSKLMDWFKNNSFYLLPEDCDNINALRKDIERVRDNVLPPDQPKIIYSDLSPSPDMNNSYYFE